MRYLFVKLYLLHFLLLWGGINIFPIENKQNLDDYTKSYYVKEKRFYLKQLWNNSKQSHFYKHFINNKDIKLHPNYYQVFFGKKGEILFSKRFLGNKLHAQFFFNKKKQITHYYYYLKSVKRRAVFYRKPGVKLKEYIYEPLRRRIQKQIFYRNDGKSLLKVNTYDHLYLRKTIIYYSNGQIRSKTEYFEGKKYYYKRNGKLKELIRFRPKRAK